MISDEVYTRKLVSFMNAACVELSRRTRSPKRLRIAVGMPRADLLGVRRTGQGNDRIACRSSRSEMVSENRQ